jgi:hypothetical protein
MIPRGQSPLGAGRGRVAANDLAMAASTDFEIQLLRKSVGALQDSHQRCVDCRRTPLTGERIYVYENGRARCELCRALYAEDPIGSELVRGDAGDHVRVRARAA